MYNNRPASPEIGQGCESTFADIPPTAAYFTFQRTVVMQKLRPLPSCCLYKTAGIQLFHPTCPSASCIISKTIIENNLPPIAAQTQLQPTSNQLRLTKGFKKSTSSASNFLTYTTSSFSVESELSTSVMEDSKLGMNQITPSEAYRKHMRSCNEGRQGRDKGQTISPNFPCLPPLLPIKNLN